MSEQGREGLLPVIQADADRAREWIEGVCGKYLANQREHDLLTALFARHRLAALAPQPDTEGWQPIETAPKDGTYIEICRVGADQWGAESTHVVQWDDDWWQVHDGKHWYGLRGPSPTFWRKIVLPAPPEIVS